MVGSALDDLAGLLLRGLFLYGLLRLGLEASQVFGDLGILGSVGIGQVLQGLQRSTGSIGISLRGSDGGIIGGIISQRVGEFLLQFSDLCLLAGDDGNNAIKKGGHSFQEGG
jgi:hypothetical protein